MSLPPEIKDLCQHFAYVTVYQSIIQELQQLVSISHPPPEQHYYTTWLKKRGRQWTRPPADIRQNLDITLSHSQDWGLWMHGLCREYVGSVQNVMLLEKFIDLWFHNCCYDIDTRPVHMSVVEVELYELLI